MRPHNGGGAVLEAACGLDVLLEAGFIPRLADRPLYEAASEALGRSYAEGFAWGFDGRTMPGETWPAEVDRRRMREGERDGRALWAAVRDGVHPDAPELSVAGTIGPARGAARAVRETGASRPARPGRSS